MFGIRSKLYGNPSLVFYVEHYIEKIDKNEVDWDQLASNPALTHILIKNIDNIVFYDDDDADNQYGNSNVTKKKSRLVLS